MALAAVPLESSVDTLLDWFELFVVRSEFRSASVRNLQRRWDVRRNAEDETPEGRHDYADPQHLDNNQDDVFLEKILLELRKRMELLGDAYPFQLDANENSLEMKQELSEGCYVYLFCLFLSNANKSEVFDLAEMRYELTNEARDLFQACATWAAAGLIGGCASAFGFPRPDGSGFLTALRGTYRDVGEGSIREELKPGVSEFPKDEGIDVVAWLPRRDGAPGTVYVLGQVATGDNWKHKSVVGDIRPFHENWFDDLPPSTPLAAMIIPFCIPLVGEATLTQQISVLTSRFGIVLYRYVVPHLAQDGLKLARSDARRRIDRTNDMPRIEQWVSDRIEDLRQARAA